MRLSFIAEGQKLSPEALAQFGISGEFESDRRYHG